MSKKVSLISKLALCFIVLVLTVAAVNLYEAKAAEKVTKRVYNLSQYKKAVKNSNVDTIIYMTESYNDIVIPASSKAKKKNLIIYCENANITNNAKFKTVTVLAAKNFTEKATGNNLTIYGNDTYLVIDEGKTVKKLTYKDRTIYELDYILRKDAKINNIVIENYDTVGKLKKNKTISMKFMGDDDCDTYGTVKYTFDENGRYVKISFDGDYIGSAVTTTYTYDKNGNIIKENVSGSYGYYLEFKYDSNNNLTDYANYEKSGSFNYGYAYEYDSNNKVIKEYEKDSKGNKELYCTYKYNKKGCITEEKYVDGVYSCKYTYNSKGCCTKKVEKSYGKLSSQIETAYDSKGMSIESKISYEEGLMYNYFFVRDAEENKVYTIGKNVETGSLGDAYFYGEQYGLEMKYEDGFKSPIDSTYGNEGGMEDADLIKQGYTVVSSVEELIEAIEPGAKIILKDGYYNMSPYLEKMWRQYGTKWNDDHKYVKLIEEYDGIGLGIESCDDLLICGGSLRNYYTIMEIDPRYCAVFTFNDCNNLTLCNLTLGHTNTGDCSGNVVDLLNCEDVNLYNMELYGCGVYGLGADHSGDITVYHSNIYSCENGPIAFDSVYGKNSFVRCVFENSRGGGYIWDSESSELIFESCAFGTEESNTWYFRSDSEYVTVNNCLFSEITRYPEY